MNRFILSGVFVLVCGCLAFGEEAKPDALGELERIVFVGNTYIEQEQAAGYLETMLTSQQPGKNLTFRNLGWSGDDLLGRARIEFAPLEQGFAILTKQVADAKPGMILANYGMNESFAGPAGLPEFVKQYSAVLDAFAKTGAKLVLLSPISHEDLGRPWPDPAGHNKNLKLYCDAIKKLAEERKALYVDLFEVKGEAGSPMTTDGIHPTAYGYWKYAMATVKGMGIAPVTWDVSLEAGGAAKASGCKVSDAKVTAKGGSFTAADEVLPMPVAPEGSHANEPAAGYERMLHVKGLAAGKYAVKAGDLVVAVGSGDDFAKGVRVSGGPETKRVHQLREEINLKSSFFFRRWRPQNDTYIIGFRKGEQGRNAVEINALDPLVEGKEAQIAKLRMPATVTYTIEAQ